VRELRYSFQHTAFIARIVKGPVLCKSQRLYLYGILWRNIDFFKDAITYALRNKYRNRFGDNTKGTFILKVLFEKRIVYRCPYNRLTCYTQSDDNCTFIK
jgi:hypothetical protein